MSWRWTFRFHKKYVKWGRNSSVCKWMLAKINQKIVGNIIRLKTKRETKHFETKMKKTSNINGVIRGFCKNLLWVIKNNEIMTAWFCVLDIHTRTNVSHRSQMLTELVLSFLPKAWIIKVCPIPEINIRKAPPQPVGSSKKTYLLFSFPWWENTFEKWKLHNCVRCTWRVERLRASEIPENCLGC